MRVNTRGMCMHVVAETWNADGEKAAVDLCESKTLISAEGCIAGERGA